MEDFGPFGLLPAQVWIDLIGQAPALVVLVFLVILFLRHLTKADTERSATNKSREATMLSEFERLHVGQTQSMRELQTSCHLMQESSFQVHKEHAVAVAQLSVTVQALERTVHELDRDVIKQLGVVARALGGSLGAAAGNSG